MKHLILFISLSVVTIQGSRASNGNDSISNYYDRKYAAELAIVDTNYALALSLYGAAFVYKQPHEKDLYNAFILACLLKDSLQGKKYFDQLTYLGLTEESLTDDLKQDRIDAGFVQKINSDYDRIRKKSQQAVFKSYAKVMDSFYSLDQGIRQYAMNTYGHIEGLKRYNDSFVVVDSINISHMLDFIRIEGFPDIYKTGFYAANYIHISSYPVIFLLLKHTWGISSARPDKAALLQEIKKAVLEGKYDPRDYAFVWDEGEGTNKYGSLSTASEYEALATDALVDRRLQEINLARKQIHLEPLDDYKKKLDFIKRCNYFHFFNFHLMMYNQAFNVPNTVKSE